ncbi:MULTISPECIES: hypothetical protein [Sporosarcina]|uniref:Uncharacterized protein n=1 Tax=Sporosarcina newyorkensis TaxID=759851 RepID=A0A1T4XXI6_9BACL|nr:hypothetical protein [Sporosarcina newyorkensis]SKA94240.1 hypothetical protein SAMN04244570_1392 [Sporosarcina newyorkensis]
MQLILHIPQLQYHLNSSETIQFNELPLIRMVEQCSEIMTHDVRRKVYYLKDMVFCEMTFHQVEIYYANNQIVFSYSPSCVDVGERITRKLTKHNISHVPVQKSFALTLKR